MSVTTTQIKVSPHTIPGTLHLQNQSALDWGWQGLLAYGCYTTVVVIEPTSVQPLQTLAHHKTNVVKVRWAPTTHHHSLNSPYSLKLASVDQSCVCVIWDVGDGSVYTEFSLGTKTLVDLQWLSVNDSCRNLLAVLVAPSTMTVWNADTGTKVSRFTFTESIHAFLFNPFKPDDLVLQSTDCLIFINDFNPGRNPTGGGKKFYLTASDTATPLSCRGKAPPHLQRRLVAGDQLRGEETIHFSESVQLVFSPAVRHRLFIMFSKDITVVDLEMQQAIGMIALERSASPFHRLLPCTQRDILYCLHENGCVSVRVNQQQDLPHPQSPIGGVESREVRYVAHGHSEPLRISKSCQVYSGALCPSTEKEVAVLTSEGRILFWETEFEQVGVYGQALSPTLLTAHTVRGVDLVTVGEEDEGYGADRGQGISLDQTVAPTWFTPPEGCTSTFGLLSLKLTLGRLWTGITGTPTVVRMSPPLTTRNWLTYAPLLAVGTSNGSVLVFNLAKRVLTKEFSIHSCPVHGIEWIHQTLFASYGYTNPNSAGHVRNEVAVTNILTGKLTFLKRPDAPTSQPQTAIDAIRISHYKNYVVVKYINRPLEFYDAKTGVFLREMVTNPPSFSCIDWIPNHGRYKTPKVDPLTLGKSSAAVDFDLAMGASDGRASLTSNKELLAVMDENGCMWQIVIDGSKVKVGNSAPTQTWLNNPGCLTWKSDLMVAGDVNGALIFFDTKAQAARTVETPRAAVKKLRFAPGKGNTKLMVLYNSRLDIRDASSDTVLSQLKWGPKDASIEDADWATSDKVVLLTSDGCVRVCEVSLKHSQSPVNTSELSAPVFCPHVILPQSCLYLKCLLQHQPWRIEYSLDSDNLTHDSPVEKAVRNQLDTLPDDYRLALLEARLGVAERCLLVGGLYGDLREVLFWRVALYYMLREKHRKRDPQYNMFKETHRRNPSNDIFQPDSDASVSIGPAHSHTPSLDDLLGPIAEGDGHGGDTLEQAPPTSSLDDVDGIMYEAELKIVNDTPPLDLNFDLLCDAKTYKRIALNRVLLFDSRRQTYDQTRRCADSLMLLGQTDRAVQMLLETDSSSDQYYTDALRACLAATIRSSGASQSTIKLVATNLIANSRLLEGVQLLCLIDKGQDSCRYLQTYGEWYHSVWLAKVTQKERDCNETFARWAEHLASSGVSQKNLALLVWLSLGNFIKVIEMLYSMRHFDQAALFAEACLSQSLIKVTKATSALLEAVFLEYARYLHSLQLTRGARHYCNKAGEKGGQLLEQLMPTSRPIRIV